MNIITFNSNHMSGQKGMITFYKLLIFATIHIISNVNCAFGQQISLFYDGDYIDTCSLNTCEGYTLRQYLSAEYHVKAFRGMDESAFQLGLECSHAFFLPETELGDFAESLDINVIELIRSYVSSGGQIFVIGSDGLNLNGSNSSSNLNRLFDFNLQNHSFASSGEMQIYDNLSQSEAMDLPMDLPVLRTTNYLTNLPHSAIKYYGEGPDKIGVFSIPYDLGEIYYIGWSFYDAEPVGAQGNAAWDSLMTEFIDRFNRDFNFPDCTRCDNESPLKVIDPGIMSYNLNNEGEYEITPDELISFYTDSCSTVNIASIIPNPIHCNEGYEQSIFIEVEDESGNILQDTLLIALKDSIYPEFTEFPRDVSVSCLDDLSPDGIDSLDHQIGNRNLDMDSLDIIRIPFDIHNLPSESVLLNVELTCDILTNTQNLWMRLVDDFGNSVLLYDRNCINTALKATYQDGALSYDCDENARQTVKPVSGEMADFSALPVGIFHLEIVALGSLECQIENAILHITYSSNLKLPDVQEACQYNLTHVDIDNRNGCPNGTIKRVFTVRDASGNTVQRSQLIFVRDQLDSIGFPLDYTVNCEQSVIDFAEFRPDQLPDSSSYPIVHGSCIDYKMNFTDEVQSVCGAHTVVINRRWTLTSVCDPDTSYIHDQMISVIDTIPPSIDSIPSYIVFANEESCVSGSNFFFPDVEDLVITDCADQLDISMRVRDASGIYYQPNEVPLGHHWVEISVDDYCGNVGRLLVPVSVLDFQAPMLRCEESRKSFFFDQFGSLEICGQELLRSAEDNCGIRRYQVSWNGLFNPDDECLTIPCDSLGFHDVVVRALDASDNQDVCTASMAIFDTIAPEIICSDIVQSCHRPFDASNFPPPIATDNCDNDITVECSDFRFVSGFCDSTYSRICFAKDASNNRARQCLQYLYRVDSISSSINWPDSLVVLECGSDIDPDITGRPSLASTCGEYQFRYLDSRSILCGQANLYRVDRKWTAINNCNGVSKNFDQVILVTDTLAPSFNHQDYDIIRYEILDFECDLDIIFDPQVSDLCSENISVYHQILGTQTPFRFRLPTGDSTFVFFAEDNCGNIDSIHLVFRVTENKNPFIACVDNYQAYTNQLGFIDLYPNGLVADVFDLCTDTMDLEYYISRYASSGQVLPRQPFVRYDCGDLGENNVRIYAKDLMGNISYCDTRMTVIDTHGLCPNSDFFNISGMIMSDHGLEIRSATAFVNDQTYGGSNNGSDGYFFFNQLPRDSVYLISVENDRDPRGGINILDLVIIKRHILEQGQIKSPYRLIAADVNKDGQITTLDMVQIRALLLNILESFPNAPSWQFIPSSFEFQDWNRPFLDPIPQYESVHLSNSSVNNANFIGLKTADVNYSILEMDTRNSDEILEYTCSSNNGITECTIHLTEDIIAGQLYLKSTIDHLKYEILSENSQILTQQKDNFVSLLWEDKLPNNLIKIRIEEPNNGSATNILNLASSNNSILINSQLDPLIIYALKPIGTHTPDNISVFPVPIVDKIYVRSSQESIRNIKLYDPSGLLIDERIDVFKKDYTMDASLISSGMYFLHTILGDGTTHTTKVIIK